MLGYVFWHSPISSAAPSEYEASLADFHRTLSAHAPAGFLGSASFHFHGGPWFSEPAGYLDWYTVADFSSLGVLNDAAVAGARKTPHDQVARLAGAGSGGLLKLAAGRASFEQARFGTWLSKPAGMSYPDFLEQASALLAASPDMALWQRQMNFGPGMEFCIHGPHRIEAPAPFRPVTLEFRRVWSSPSTTGR